MDFSKLRSQALNSEQEEEAVTVNTRALIDKVLARYSGEWTTLRELIQNAADASATTVRIRFETLPSPTTPSPPHGASDSDILNHILLHHTLRTLLVTNDGDVFNDNDWSRLKRIAEGNPDETKIGAFGVGFYSVFADCEEPFVQSGSEAMAFYWKTNSLFTRRIKVPQDSSTDNRSTNFVLNYRNTTSSVPNLLSIAQFLATSMTFVALQHIELWLDDFKVFSVQKKTSPSIDMPIPRDVDTKTKGGMMKLQSLSRESVQMDATFMHLVGYKPQILNSVRTVGESSFPSESNSLRSFFSRLTANTSVDKARSRAEKEDRMLQEIVLENLTATTTTSAFLRLTTATIRTSVSTSFAAELERATKKPPPKTTKMSILTSTYDDVAATEGTSKSSKIAKSVDIFASVMPQSSGQRGRIFIGFPTSQTTGAGFHVAAPSVIPTVERESIDLNARWVRDWNEELLRVVGMMSRLSFSSEMSILAENVTRVSQASGGKTSITKEIIARYTPEALHILKTFSYTESTPSAKVAPMLEEAFWTTVKKPIIDVFSTQGVLSSKVVRIATEDFSGFVEGIPVVPDSLVATPFISKLRDYGLLTEITIADVKKELGTKALTRDQLVAFINWLGKEAVKGAIDTPTVQSLLEVTVATIGQNDQGGIIALSTIKYYRNVNKISPDLPASPDTIPFDLTRLSNARELEAIGWEPLEIIPWLRFLIDSRQGRNGLDAEYDLTWSPKFSALVLATISKLWTSMNEKQKNTIVELLSPLTVIPTKLGMNLPKDAYFANVKLFDDLPTVEKCPGVKEGFLAALGVRKTVELDKIFERLLTPPAASMNGEEPAAKWSHVDLITYLASVKDDIPLADIAKLRNTPICSAEVGPPGQESTRASTERYKISQLFEPKDNLRQLGLPIVQWPGKVGLRMGSLEGRFLTFLGLRAFPSVPELVEMMASTTIDPNLRSKAMSYFISNHHMNNYANFDLSTSNKKFLPIMNDEKRLVAPSQVFAHEKSAILGFDVLRRDLVIHLNKFGVAEHPPLTACMVHLISQPPRTRKDAIALYSYFYSRMGEIGANHVAQFADAPIVPVFPKTSTPYSDKDIRFIAPNTTFIGSSEAYQNIFDFVDFSPEANSFLLHVGAKHEPSRIQVAQQVCSEPARILGIVQTPEKYLHILRTLADALPELKKDKALFKKMKTSPFLLSTRLISSKKSNAEETGVFDDASEEEEEEEAGIVQYVLDFAHKIVVVDDYRRYTLFKDVLLAAPFEESIEAFYVALGSENVSQLLEEDTRIGSALPEQVDIVRIHKHIVDRSKLFLHEYRPETIKRNAKWLEKSVSISLVSSLTARLSLRGYSLTHTAKLNASLKHDRSKGWILYLTPQNDYWHISEALVPQLLMKPTTQAVTQLEFFLKESLRSLKSRGFNVDRILRSQAAESRIAEAERQKQLLAEQKQIQAQEEQWKRDNAHEKAVQASRKPANDKSKQIDMPGSFNESPEASPTKDSRVEARRPNSIFSRLTRQLGLDHNQTDMPQQPIGTTQDNGTMESDGFPSNQNDAGKGGGQIEKVSSPAALQQNLINAVNASRPHNSSNLFTPPRTNSVKETQTYCDSQSAQNLQMAGTLGNGMRIYTAKDLSMPVGEILSTYAAPLQTFSSMLLDVVDIYSAPRSSIHIYYDESGSTIAFNSSGAIFANFRFFLQLHAANMTSVKGKTDATSYWWIVMSHELAHNLVSDHSAAHSFYAESFAQWSFGRMSNLANSYKNLGEALPEYRQIQDVPHRPGQGNDAASRLLEGVD